MKFDITKKVELSEFGEKWKDCYLEFKMPNYAEVSSLADLNIEELGKKVNEILITKLEELFIGGKAVEGGEVVNVTKSDIKEFPLTTLTKCFQLITGQVDPK